MNWALEINRLLRSIEAHLTDETDMDHLAAEAHLSPFHMQRMFAVLTDIPLGEYIRQRRLSQAGQELQRGGLRVIDAALKYGYETPESFQKAFRRFHGVTPSAARKSAVPLRYLNPLQIEISLTGGSIMDYRVENLGEMTMLGMERKFQYDNSFVEIPKFWDEYYQKGYAKQVCGCLGICLDDGGSTEFSYLIASFCDADAPVPEGFVKRTIAPHTWVKFKAVGPMPGALQKVNRQIFQEWLPNNPEYSMAANLNIEYYSKGDMQSPAYESEIWLPVRKKE